ncbi:MAG: hypothetical protein K0R59_2011 [Sphingobacterium sp.]|jgi:hypothetical protein|nr:hypothetical protein [Sphingobacterium sp.]
MNEQTIIAILRSRIGDFSKGQYGLYDGLTGDILFSFLYSRLYNNKVFRQLGNEGLEVLQDNISQVKSLDRAEGLAGIGWAIEWLAQHRFIQVDTNDVLSDIESLIYRVTSFSSDSTISFASGIIDKIVYFLQRFSNQSLSRYTQYTHRECLTYLSDDLYHKFELMKGHILADKKNTLEGNEAIRCLSEILMISTPLLKAGVNISVCEKMLYEAVDITRVIMEEYNQSSYLENPRFNNLMIFQTIAALAVVGKSYNQAGWTQLAECSCEIYLSRNDLSSYGENEVFLYYRSLVLLDSNLTGVSDLLKCCVMSDNLDVIKDNFGVNDHMFYKFFPYKFIRTNYFDDFLFFYF